MKTIQIDPSLYVVVPRNATPAMQSAWDGTAVINDGYYTQGERWQVKYRAMLAAAPPLPEQPQGEPQTCWFIERKHGGNFTGEWFYWIRKRREKGFVAEWTRDPRKARLSAMIDGATAHLLAPLLMRACGCVDDYGLTEHIFVDAPAGAAAPATAPSALQEFVQEQRQVEAMAADEAKASSSIRAPVPDEPQPAVREAASFWKERDDLWCKAILQADLKEVQKILEWFNEHRPEAVADSYWCSKCGYHGKVGGLHKGCGYSAMLIKGKSATPKHDTEKPR